MATRRGMPTRLVALAGAAAGIAVGGLASADAAAERAGAPRQVILGEAPGLPGGGQVDRWITEADRRDPRHIYSAGDRAALRIIVLGESSGRQDPPPNPIPNPGCGGPPRGAAQVCAPTYAAHRPASCSAADILLPACNIAAAADYAIGRYGSLDLVPGVLAVRRGDPYIGY